LRRNDSHLRALKVWHVGWAMRLPTMHLAFYEMQQCGVFAPTAQGWKRPLNALLKEVQKEAFGLIVDESSADPGLDGVQSIPLDADHFATCKPAHKGALIYQRTLSYLRQAIEKPPQISARHMQLTNAEIDAMRRSFEKEFTAREGVAPDWFREIFDGLGLQDLSAVEMRDMAREAIAAYRARAQQKVEPSNLGSDIDEAIAAARAKLQPEGPAAALAALDAKLGVEREKLVDQQRRTLALLREKAAILRIGYDHAATRAALTEIARLEPDDASVWVEIGDLWNRTGNLAEARKAFLWALTAARDAGFQPNIAASYDRIGDVLVAQGDLPGALVEFRAGMAIRKALADADAGNAGWRRDLSVSHNNIGDVLVAQGRSARCALANSAPAWRSIKRSPTQTPATRAGGAISPSRTIKSATCSSRRAICPPRSANSAPEWPSPGRSPTPTPGHAGWRRDLSVSHERIGDVLVAQGDLPGALVEISRRHGHPQGARRRRRRQRGVAARSLRLSRQNRRRARRAGRSARRARRIPRRHGDRQGARRRRPPGHAGVAGAISPSLTIKSATCSSRRGDLPGALVEFRAGMAIRKALADARRRQRGVAARSLRLSRQNRRRARRAGRSARCARRIPRRHGDRQGARRRRPRPCGVAARSLRLSQQYRRRARQTGRPARRAQGISRRNAIAKALADADPRPCGVAARSDRLACQAGGGHARRGAGASGRGAGHRPRPRRDRATGAARRMDGRRSRNAPRRPAARSLNRFKPL
jgi:tetratricopeptide (TPR) repeat protein